MDKKTTKDKLKFIINKIVKKNYFNNFFIPVSQRKRQRIYYKVLYIKILTGSHENIYRQCDK